MNKIDLQPIAHFNYNGKAIPYRSIPSFIVKLVQSNDKTENNLGNFLSDWFDDASFITVKTSGSTGNPKVIRLSKRAMVQSAKNTLSYFHLKAGDTICLTLPCLYVAGKMMVIRALIGNLNLITAPASSNPFSKVTSQFNFVALVPNQIESFLQYESVNKQSCKVLVGGGSISNTLYKKIQNSPSLFYQSYALTETASHVAIRAINDTPFTSNAYEALDGITFKKDKRNCLVIYSNYLDQSKFVTNDIVELLSPTSFLYKGRFDNIINSAGIKLNPELIEHKLESFIEARFYIGKMEDDVLGHKIILIIEGNKNHHNTNDLNVRMRELLHKHEVPKQLIFIDEFKETPTGKIIREY